MPRFDLYTPVHKAVRALLFEALAAVGRTDFARAGELAPALAAVRRALRLTRLHAEHEDREVHPLLFRLAPEVAAELETGHDRSDGLGSEIERDLARIELAMAAERVSLGRRVHERLGRLVADTLTHLAFEESRASRILWAHLSDAELGAVQARVLAAMEPAETGEWLEWMLPACHLGERAELLASLSAAAPAEAFVALTTPARVRLGAARWNEALAAAQALGSRAREGAAS